VSKSGSEAFSCDPPLALPRKIYSGKMSSSMVNLVVKNLFAPAEDIMLEVKKDMTVLGLKEMLSHECKSRPVIHDQQIVHYGRLLKDDSHLGSIPLEGFQPLVLHLIVKGDTLRGILNSSHYNSPGYANSHIAPVISLPSMVCKKVIASKFLF